VSKRIIVSGNKNYGLAKSLRIRFPEAKFCSRSTGYDFLNTQDRKRFVEETHDYDVYISCSSLRDFLQVILLREVVDSWQNAGKGGHLLVIGSSVDLETKGQNRIYTTEKKALKEYCLGISLMAKRTSPELGPNNPIKVTHISPGFLDTPSIVQKFPDIQTLSCDYVAGIVEWSLNQPDSVNLHQLSLTSIQTEFSTENCES
jgi:hypothetical protein